MAGKSAVARLFLFTALAALFLLAFGSHAKAVTYKINYTTSLSCAGVDAICGTTDDSCYCTPSNVGQAYNPGATADMKTIFQVPNASPAAPYSNFSKIYTFGVPVSFWVALDRDIPNGAFVGNLQAKATLSLLNQPCTTPYNLDVTIPLFDCTTDITDTITWDTATTGANLVADVNPANGLPDGCDHYPVHALLDPDGAGVKPPLMPRSRYYGYTNAVPNAPPTQINFVYYNAGQLTLQSAKPDNDMGDSLGFPNFVIMDNPGSPAAPSSISDMCTPLDTITTMLGVTAGEGKAIAKAGPNGEYSPMCTGTGVGVDNDSDTVVDDGCFVVTDKCRDLVDNDGDTKIDELCDLNRQINATVPGVYGTGSHMADAYSASYRDYDGDGASNPLDGCPCNDAGGDGAPDPDGDNDGIPDVCDPTDDGSACTLGSNDDCDGDSFQNRQDNCALHANGGLLQVDTDRDGIGDACEATNLPANWNCGATSPTVADGPYANDMTVGAVCIGETDTDGDGWCDSTETLLGSDPNNNLKTPEYKGIDYKVVAADNPPGQAPQSCSNLTYYGTGLLFGTAVDDNGVNGANAADPQCAVIANDKDQDGVPDLAPDNCVGTAPGKDANPAQLNTDATGEGGSYAGWTGGGDALGDACDADADNDGADKLAEWGHGTDPKSAHGASPFDLNADQKVSILDVLLFKPKLSPAPYDYDYDFDLGGSVSILDVLLFKPVLGQIAVDKYDVEVIVAGTGVVKNATNDYSVPLIVSNTKTLTATSRENNRGPDTVPIGKAVISFSCNVPVGLECVWVTTSWPTPAGEILTKYDIEAFFKDYKGNWLSAWMPQVWKVAPDQNLVPGDGIPWTVESDLHYFSDKAEPKNTNVDFTRDFQLHCTTPGTYTVYIDNKTLPRLPYTEWNRWDNESVATLHVTCTMP